MTPSEIAALRALCDAATPGPWAAYGRGVDSEAAETYGQTVIGQETRGRSYMTYEELVVSDPDQAFIIAARTALPQALSALEEARKCDSPTPVLGCDCTRCIQHFHRAAVLARNAAEFRADALQAEVEKKANLARDLADAAERLMVERNEALARADAAWRAVETARALSVGWEAKGDAPRRYSYPEADAADGAERDTYRRCADDLKAALPPPSATDAPRVTRAEIEEALRQGGREAKAAEHYRRTGYDDPKLVATAAPAEEPVRCATFSADPIPADVRARMDADRKAAEEEMCPGCGVPLAPHPVKGTPRVHGDGCPGRAPSRGGVAGG